jgi:hypothetical protein
MSKCVYKDERRRREEEEGEGGERWTKDFTWDLVSIYLSQIAT